MSNVSITDTTYNITVEESDTSVTVTSGDAITVLVDTFTISTQVNNTGTGAEIGKDILGDTLFLRSLVAGSGITITENTNDITIGYTNTAGYITDYTVTEADVTGHQAALSITESQISDLQSYITGYTVTEADVTGHQAALTITESQISDLDHYTNTDWDTQLATKTTSNLTEGTNLYYTQTRANDSILNYTGNINNMGDITGDDAIFDNVRSVIETDNINAIGSNITMDLSGYLHVDTDEMYVGSFTQAVKITDTGITNLGSTALTFTGNLTGDVTGTVSDVSNHDTGDIAEGSNLYYTDARVQTKLGSVSGHILPDNTVGTRDLGSATNNWGRIYGDQLYVDNFYALNNDTFTVQGHIVPTGNKLWDLGTPSNQFRSAYIGPGSLYIDGQKVIGSDATGDIDITTDSGQNLNISSGADIKFIPQVGETDQGFVVELDRVELGVDADSTITLNGTAEIPDLHIGDLEIDPTLINNTGTNQNLEIRTNGTGYLHANTSNLYVGPISGATKITANSVSATAGTLTVTGDLIGDVTGTVSDISNHTTSALTEGTNLYHTDARARSAVSLSTSNVNELSYDNTTGVFTYVSPSTVAATGQVVFDVRNASGVDIARGDAVYIAGHSGGKVLVAKADANSAGEHPAVGLANSAMTNNSDGSVLTHGEMLNVDTSTFSTNDVLYLSETAGELTATRPSSSATAVQNIGKVARSDNNNGIIIVSGAGRENDVPNLASGTVFIGNGSGYDKRALTTADVSEGANLYYTDARAQAVINTNSAGFITTYDPTEADITEHQAALSITESQISDLTHYTNAQAISAVQGEATLDLTGDVSIAQDLDVTGIIKVNDGYVLSSFDPYGPAGLPSTAMDTTIMGVGQESGWAGLSIRSRGEHAWGLTGFGIPNEAPRALLAMQGGRLDGSSDDYLNNGDKFAEMMFNPYSGYRTGTEWLTPGAMIEALATEDHSASGMGTKLVLKTTENGNQAGATDASHTNASITIQGTTLSTSDTLKLDDDVIITGTTELQGNLSSNGSELTVADNLKVKGSGSSNTVIGDSLIAGLFDTHGFKINADETNWAGITLEEYVGAGDKPLTSGFANATVAAQVIGGTPSAKTNVIANKRLLTIQGIAANQTDGTLPATANFRIKGETTEDQTTSNRGTKLTFETIANGNNGTTESLKIQGNEIVIHTNGDGKIKTGGNLILDDDVQVTGTLDVTGNSTFDGNVTLGDANTDVITSTGKLKASNGFNNTVLDTATANYLSGVLQIVETGDQAYISDGNAGSPCMAFYDGSNWKKFHSPADNISSS